MKRKLYGNTKRIATIFCICIGVITVALFVLRLSLFQDMVSTPEANVQNVTGRWLQYSLNEDVYFSSNSAAGNVLIESNPGNTCYMIVDIIDPDTKDTLIYTGFMEPGESIDALKLDKVLGDGVYVCTAQVSAYDLETRDFLGRDEKTVTLYVGVHPSDAAE